MSRRNAFVTYYGAGDHVLQAHEVDFKLERRGSIRIFTFFNWTVTEGSEKDHKSLEPVSYIYHANEHREGSTQIVVVLKREPAPASPKPQK